MKRIYPDMIFSNFFSCFVISATSNERILERVSSDFLQRANFAMSSEWFFATSDFCNEKRANFATSIEWLFAMSNFCNKKRVIFCNGQLLQQVRSKFCSEQRVVLQRVTSKEWISTSNEQRVKSYASNQSFENLRLVWQ